MVLDFTDIKRVVSPWIDEKLDPRMLLPRSDPMVPLLQEHGEPLFAEVPTKTRISLRLEQTADGGYLIADSDNSRIRRVDADGTITLLGRGSVSINSGGEKIFPEEVEGAVKGHPDVYDCVVVGVKDDRWGQRVVAVVQALLPALRRARGRVVLMGSIGGRSALPFLGPYAASKHALHGFFDSLRAELHGTGVGITLVCPSFVRTGIGDHALGGDGVGPPIPRTETARPADPADVADAIFDAAVRRRRLLLPSRLAKLSYVVARLSPIAYERMMVRRILRNAR